MKDPSDTPRGRFRFSLLTTIFLVTFVAMAMAMWRLYSELQPLRDEVIQLRTEAGYLTIDDANRDRVHAIRVQTGNPLFWKWKVYLPDDRDYRLGAFVGELPPEGEVPDKLGPLSSPARHRMGSEQIVAISIIRNSDGELVLRQQLSFMSTQTRLSAEQEEILARSNATRGRSPSAGFGGTAYADSGKPLVLLNQQRWDHTDQASVNGPARGIIVWIEPIENAKSE